MARQKGVTFSRLSCSTRTFLVRKWSFNSFCFLYYSESNESFSGSGLSAWGIRGVIITLWNVALTPRTSCFSLSMLFIVFSHISILGHFRSIPWKVIDPPVLTCITSCWSGCHDEAVHQNVHCCRQAHTKKYYRVYEFCGGYHCAFK